MGFRDNPWPYYRAFDCKNLGSLEDEGISQSLMEAMLAGCPVIGTIVGGIPDIIHHQDTGLLVPPGDKQKLADAISQIIDNPEKTAQRVKNAEKFINNHHTIDVMGENITTLY